MIILQNNSTCLLLNDKQMLHGILFSLLQLLDEIQNTKNMKTPESKERKFVKKVREIGKNATGEKASQKIAPRKHAPKEKCLPEKRLRGKFPPEKCSQKNCFTRFLLLLTLSYSFSFLNFL